MAEEKYENAVVTAIGSPKLGDPVELIKVEIKRIIGPTPSGAAVLLGNDTKTFVVFVGFFEAAALIREMNEETPARPLTHELIQNVFIGFDIEVKQIVISAIIENTFCATLTLQQRMSDESGEWVGRRNEVRIDARPSDCFVLSLKNKLPLFVSDEVFQQVQDVSKMTDEVEGNLVGMSAPELEFDFRPDAAEFGGGEDDELEDLDEDDFLVDDEGEEDYEGFGGLQP